MKTKRKPNDQHKSGFLVRLPESYRPLLEAVKKKTRRATTVEVQIALDRHFAAESLAASDITVPK